MSNVRRHESNNSSRCRIACLAVRRATHLCTALRFWSTPFASCCEPGYFGSMGTGLHRCVRKLGTDGRSRTRKNENLSASVHRSLGRLSSSCRLSLPLRHKGAPSGNDRIAQVFVRLHRVCNSLARCPANLGALHVVVRSERDDA